MLITKSETQPIENATLGNVCSGDQIIAVKITAAEGYELVEEGKEPCGISSVNIPLRFADRVALYKSIPKTETEEE